MVSVIESIIFEAKMIPGDISFIITGDTEIRNINREFLDHDYFTDVITFNYNKGNIVGGEIYISKDTVVSNAKEYKVNMQDELKRVIIHGVLHLTDLDDKTEGEREIMRKSEDRWLTST
jgi:probable rRNA maturation factor